MSESVYLFGKLSNEYTQYPDDYTRNIFQTFYANATTKTQIAVHRDNNLVYYGYVRKLDDNVDKGAGEDSHYIGLCIILNGVMIPNFKSLFTAFEKTIAYLATNGNILELNDKGNIISKVDRLYENQEEIERAIEFVNNTIKRLSRTWQPLPPTNYGIANNAIKKFTISDDKKLISEAICEYRWIYIYKADDYDTQSLTDAIKVIIKNQKVAFPNHFRDTFLKWKEWWKKVDLVDIIFDSIDYIFNFLSVLGVVLMAIIILLGILANLGKLL